MVEVSSEIASKLSASLETKCWRNSNTNVGLACGPNPSRTKAGVVLG
jgi:hypothetical protein